MAKGFKHGGSSPLNFNLVCNPQPANPRENTIWVDTDKINNYYFSATQPENLAEYDVWILTGTASTSAFNATKKNPIMVYPIYASQYIGGALVKKTAKSWQDGKWVDWWNGMLYKDGNEYEYVTGGWVASAWNSYSHNTATEPTVTRTNESIAIALTGNGVGGCLRTENKIDLTAVKELRFEFDINIADGIVHFVVARGANSNTFDAVASGMIANAVGTEYVIDVSNITGSYYVCVEVCAYNGNTKKLTMYECIAEV